MSILKVILMAVIVAILLALSSSMRTQAVKNCTANGYSLEYCANFSK